ncbi:MAG: hypothetical protein M3Y23_03285, partial [Actinomycetota bacterium]|nr:hypothetical protein [Actinomycetota bacterium]
AGLIGFAISRGSSEDTSAPAVPADVAFERARESALRELTTETARHGFRDGRSEGLRHGKNAGRIAGRTDALVAISQQEAASAQSEAAAAQSELSAISSAPPTP